LDFIPHFHAYHPDYNYQSDDLYRNNFQDHFHDDYGGNDDNCLLNDNRNLNDSRNINDKLNVYGDADDNGDRYNNVNLEYSVMKALNRIRFEDRPALKGPVTKTYKISKTFNAPKSFVFDWCTDFMEDDYKMTGSTARRRFLERTKDRVIWVVKYKDGKRSVEGIRAVWLKPQNSWHLETCGDGRELGDYNLTELRNGRTRLDMVFNVTYDDPSEAESTAEWTKDVKRNWSNFAKFLEKEYKNSTNVRAR